MPRRVRAWAVLAPLALALGLAGGPVAGADAAEAEFDPGARALVERLAAAVNADDVEALKRLLHPDNLACMDAGRADFYTEFLARELGRTVPAEYGLRIAGVGAADSLLFEAMDEYPVRPTHQIELSYSTGAYSGVSIVRYLRHDGGRWFYIVPCPTPEATEMFRQASLEREKEAVRVEALAAGMDEALRAELNALLAAGDRVAAMTALRRGRGRGPGDGPGGHGRARAEMMQSPKYMQFKLFLVDFKDIGVIIVTLGAVPACSRRASTPYVRKT